MGNNVQKTQKTQQTRILALDLHPRGFGYIVMDSPSRLLDWGVRRSYQKTKNHPEVLVGGGLRPLLKIWEPDVVVTRIDNHRQKDLQPLFRQIKEEVGEMAFLLTRGSRPHYLGRGKYERAVVLAARFSEIGWKLPPKRKPWESENYSMTIFEALGVALTCVS
jgi:hypothetical protein